MNPAINIIVWSPLVVKSPEPKSLAIFPKISGTTIKKEKRAALSLSIPNKTEVEMVAPDLDIPGKIAIAWDMPIIREDKNPTFLFVVLALSARKRRKPVTKSIVPTNKILPLKRGLSDF